MERDVAIRVTDQARHAVERERRRGAGARRARRDGCRDRCRSTPGRADGRERDGGAGEIGGHGHLEVDRIAGNDMDRDSTGLEQGGLVGPRPSALAAVGRAPGGARRDGCPAGSGPWPGLARSTVSTMRPPTTRLTVSATGRTGMAAPWSAAAAATARRAPAATSGRAPSWTSTTPARRRRPGPRASRAAKPAATESCRRAPPATTVETCAGSHGAGGQSSRRSAAVTTTIALDAWRRRDRVERVRPAAAGRRWARPACRAAHPARGAGGDDDRVRSRGGTSGAVNPGAAGRRSSGRRRSGAPA